MFQSGSRLFGWYWYNKEPTERSNKPSPHQQRAGLQELTSIVQEGPSACEAWRFHPFDMQVESNRQKQLLAFGHDSEGLSLIVGYVHVKAGRTNVELSKSYATRNREEPFSSFIYSGSVTATNSRVIMGYWRSVRSLKYGGLWLLSTSRDAAQRKQIDIDCK
jgi:hypothetical protein